MSETNLQSVGRVLYVEPNDLYSNKMPNGIPHPYEDYCISVDLTVEFGDRNSLGPVGPAVSTQKCLQYSSDKKTISFIGGTDGFLTTNFTDIQNVNPERNTNECLGIESITIQYNSWYVPQVNIKFIDVRGASLFGPQEQGYVNTVRYDKTTGHEDNTSIYGGSFFKSLFSFPYPLFKLKVKGFYGKEVTYNLAVEDFQGNFNADNGNFEVDVRFIGYMFGVYTDIPMNYLMVSPYISGIGDKYWEQQKSNGRFKYFGDSVPYYKYPELMDRVAHLTPKEDDVQGEGINYATKKRRLEGKISALTSIKDDMLSMLNTIFDRCELSPFVTSDGTKGYGLLAISRKYEKVCVQTAPKYDENKETIYDLTNTYDAFIRKVKTYNSKYGNELSVDILGFNIEKNIRNKISPETTNGKDFKTYKTNQNGTFSKETVINSYDYFDHTTKYLTSVDPDNYIDEYEWIQKSLVAMNAIKDTPLYVYHPDSRVTSLPSWLFEIDKKIKNTEKDLEEVKEYIEKHRDEAISKQLGFGVSIGNAFEMAFAHMETFMYVFNHYLRQIKNVQDAGNRSLDKLGNFNIDNTDLPRSFTGQTPPFTLFYKEVESEGGNSNTNERSSKKKVIMWPGSINGLDPSALPEIDFVNRLIEAGKGYSKESQELEALRTLSEPKNGDGDNEANNPGQTFVPVTLYDLAHPDSQNPYTYLSTMERGNKVWEGLFYTFCLRLFYWYRGRGPQEKNEVYDDFGKIEAYNVYLAHTKILPAIKTWLNDRKGRTPEANFNELDSYFTKDSTEEDRKLYDIGKDMFNKHLLVRGGDNYKYDWTKWSTIKADIVTSAGTVESRDINVKYFPTNIWSPLKIDTVKLKDRTRNDTNSDCMIYLYGNLGDGNKLAQKSLNIGCTTFQDALIVDKSKHTLDYYNKYLNKIEGSRISKVKKNYEKHILPELTALTYSVGSGRNENQRTKLNAVTIANSSNALTRDGAVKIPDSIEGNNKSYYLSSPAFINICVGDGQYEYYQLYGHPIYYQQNIIDDPERRLLAKAFLHAIGIKMGCMEITPSLKETLAHSYYTTLREGAMWYRQRWMKEHPGSDIIELPIDDYILADADHVYTVGRTLTNGFPDTDATVFIDKKSGIDATGEAGYGTYEQLEKRNRDKDALADFFEDWAKNVYPELNNLFEIKLGVGYTDSADNFQKKVIDSIAKEKEVKLSVLNNNINGRTDGAVNLDFYDENSVIHVKYGKALDLSAKRVSDTQASLLKDYEKYTIIIDTTKRAEGSLPPLTIPVNVVSAATVSFINELIELYRAQLEQVDNVEESNGIIPYDPDRDVDVKISTYLTLKNLYDRWICTVKSEKKWKLNAGEESEFSHFKYIDGFYRKIKERAPVNFEYVCEVASQMMSSSNINNEATNLNYQGRSFYDFLASICQKNQMMLLSLPMENEFTDPTGITEMFDVKSYSQMDRRDTSCFVCLYPNKPSQHLEIQDDGLGYKYATDGFNIANAMGNVLNVNDLIPQLADVDVDAYPIPAFGVTYAKQNQSIFKKINVNMQNPQVTEASIAATQLIASKYNEGPNKTALYGQDLYRIYSNYSYTCSVEMLGNAQIMPMTYFQLNNIPLFKGVYMIINIEHSISAGDMVTKFTGVRLAKYEVPLVKDDGLFNDPFIETNYTNKGNSGMELPPLNADYTLVRKYTVEMGDFLWSNSARDKNIENVPDTTEHRDNLLNLQTWIQLIQDAWAGYCASNSSQPWAQYDGIYVSSGYRCSKLNEAVGGTKSSSHLCGCAADIQVCKYDTTKADPNSRVSGRHNGAALISREYTEKIFYPFLVNFLKDNNYEWDQAIDEKKSSGSRWTHFSPVSCSGLKRKQIFELVDGQKP